MKRFRLSTLMLLVVIAALSTYIVVERWQRVQEVRRLAVERERAMVALLRAAAQTERARAQALGASPPARASTSTSADK